MDFTGGVECRSSGSMSRKFHSSSEEKFFERDEVGRLPSEGRYLGV